MTSGNNQKEENKVFKEDFRKEIVALIAELCFIFLPFIVIIIINLTNNSWENLIHTSNWSLAAALLFGQSLVKIIMGVASQEHSFNYQAFGLIAALILVFGLVPSITVLAIIETSILLSTGLIIIQFILLALSIYTFLHFGTIGQVLYSTAFRLKISKLLGLNKESK
ncbi:hypothetical protein [Marivirga harenae]|uniref:hypothetical protein n=1 Tax=Marivirga harenae TaxID=2010992 RepID=UPI0026E06097|nr:hypothetical protein [Marivirga harenae]WKV11266.1 hypothetical protein Q3Y49_13725 [Marivirga harenae]